MACATHVWARLAPQQPPDPARFTNALPANPAKCFAQDYVELNRAPILTRKRALTHLRHTLLELALRYSRLVSRAHALKRANDQLFKISLRRRACTTNPRRRNCSQSTTAKLTRPTTIQGVCDPCLGASGPEQPPEPITPRRLCKRTCKMFCPRLHWAEQSANHDPQGVRERLSIRT